MQIIAEKLTYIYNPKSKFATKALDNLSITIHEGDFLGVIGHTGSGKSTFVQHLNALIKATSGQLTVGKFDLTAKKNKIDFLKLRSQVGLVFQYPEYQLFADTVENDIQFGLNNFHKNLSLEEKKGLVKEAIEIVGLDYADIKDKSPFELSGGQKRRVAIAGVLVSKPEILILDEPAAGLDPLGKQEIMQLLHKVHNSWCKTIIIISHDMDEIAENCTHAAVFDYGKLILYGSPKEIFSEEKLLQQLGLDVPTTAKLTSLLKARGVAIDSTLKMDNFVAKIMQVYTQQRGNEDVK